MNKKQKVVVCVYVIGMICVVYFLAQALIGGSHVSNPDAMLPYTDFERNSMILALGCVPMTISCILLIRWIPFKKRMQRMVVFAPAIITAVPFVTMIGIVLIMLVQGYFGILFG